MVLEYILHAYTHRQTDTHVYREKRTHSIWSMPNVEVAGEV